MVLTRAARNCAAGLLSILFITPDLSQKTDYLIGQNSEDLVDRSYEYERKQVSLLVPARIRLIINYRGIAPC